MRATIETTRLRLVPWDAGATHMLGSLAGDPCVVRHVADGSAWPRERVEEVSAAQLEHWARRGFGWRVIVERETGERVGLAMLQSGEGVPALAPDDVEIGWWLDPSRWRRGYGREAARALVEEAFGRLGAPSVVARIQPANAPSLAIARALGMAFEREATGRAGERVEIHRRLRP